jgi:hypothetical protein
MQRTERKSDVDELETGFAPSLFDLAASRRRAELAIAAAHMEGSLDHNEFVDLIDELVSAVRLEHDALRESRIPPTGPRGQGRPRRQWMQPDHGIKIRADAKAYLEEHKRRKLPPGYAQRVGDELGYTLAQVQTALYRKAKP